LDPGRGGRPRTAERRGPGLLPESGGKKLGPRTARATLFTGHGERSDFLESQRTPGPAVPSEWFSRRRGATRPVSRAGSEGRAAGDRGTSASPAGGAVDHYGGRAHEKRALALLPWAGERVQTKPGAGSRRRGGKIEHALSDEGRRVELDTRRARQRGLGFARGSPLTRPVGRRTRRGGASECNANRTRSLRFEGREHMSSTPQRCPQERGRVRRVRQREGDIVTSASWSPGRQGTRPHVFRLRGDGAGRGRFAKQVEGPAEGGRERPSFTKTGHDFAPPPQ